MCPSFLPWMNVTLCNIYVNKMYGQRELMKYGIFHIFLPIDDQGYSLEFLCRRIHEVQ